MNKTNNMQIKVRQQTEKTIDIELPAFFGSEDHETFIGVINEDTVIKFSRRATLKSFQSGRIYLFQNDIAEAYQNWISISESEFIEVHESFLQSFSLMPKMIKD